MWELKKVRLKNSTNVIIGNLNINSLSGKFEQLNCLISNLVDILLLTETKLDEILLTSSILRDVVSSPFRLDQNRKGGSILIYVRSGVHSKLLTKHSFPNDTEMVTYQNIPPTLGKQSILF